MDAKEARNKILAIVNQRSLHSIYEASDEAMWIMQVLESYHQVNSKEEAIEDIVITELNANSVSYRGATVLQSEAFERIAENITENILEELK